MPERVGDLVVTNARLWDGTGAAPVDHVTVIVRSGRIDAAGRGIEAPSGIPTFDAGGRFVMPGLVEMHGHVLLAGGEDSLRCFLGTGVTSVRDVGGATETLAPMRRRLAEGDLEGPRLFVYGPLLDGDPPIFAGGGSGPSLITYPSR